MNEEIWATSENGSIRYQLLTKKYLDDACGVLKATLFTSGNLCKAVGVPNDPEAAAELDQLPRRTAKDGVTVIAIDGSKDKVVGVAFNKILQPGGKFYDDLAKSFRNFRALQIIDLLHNENICNLFEHCQVDCLMEIMLLGTLPEYRKRGIAKKMCEISVEVAQKLLDGVNVKQSIDGEELPLEPVPKMVTATFGSFISQRIGRQLGFEIAVARDNREMKLLGKAFENSVEAETPTTNVEYKKLHKN